MRAALWVELRDWEGGRVQHIDTHLLLGSYSVLEMANGRANADLRTGNTKTWRYRRSSRCVK